MAVLALGATSAWAEDCDSGMKWDKVSQVCRKACCTKDTTPGETECAKDTEVCWQGKYCLPVSEANARRAAAAASKAHKAEEAAKAAAEAKAEAEAEAGAARAAQAKAEVAAKAADKAKAEAEAEAEAAKAAQAKAEVAAKAAEDAKAEAEAERKLALAKAKAATSPSHFEVGGAAWLLFAGIHSGVEETSLPFGGRLRGDYNFFPDKYATLLLGGGGECYSLPERDSYGQGLFLELAGRFFLGQRWLFLQPALRGGVSWAHYREDGVGPYVETVLGLGVRPSHRFLLSLEGGWRRDTIQFGGADTGVCLLNFTGGLPNL